jgi:threonylcarbamoyladenosine tRNA methylthiotransferase MtaB
MSGIVPFHQRKERNKILRNLSAKKLHDFTASQLGSVWPVLFEEEQQGGLMMGYTSNYIRVSVPYQQEMVNRIVSCELTEIGSNGLVQAQPLGFLEASPVNN